MPNQKIVNTGIRFGNRENVHITVLHAHVSIELGIAVKLESASEF